MKRVVLLKLSGEALSKKDGFGLDMEKVNNVAGEIKTLKDTGVSLGIVRWSLLLLPRGGNSSFTSHCPCHGGIRRRSCSLGCY